MSFPRSARAIVLASLLPVSLATAAPVFEVVDLGLVPGAIPATDISSGQSVNNSGVVVGSSTQNSSSGFAVISENGAYAFLGTRDEALRRAPVKINGSGSVAGYSSSQGWTFQGGTYTMLAAPSRLSDMNDSGAFCGTKGSYPAYGSGTTLTEIMPAPGQPAFGGGIAEAINNAGQIVGLFSQPPSGAVHTGFYLGGPGALPQLILPLAGYTMMSPTAINASGAFAGDAIGGITNEGFYCAGIGQALQIIPRRGDMSYARVNAMADDGSIIGPTNGGGYLYQGGIMYRLTEIVNASAAGWVFDAAYAISPDARYITGIGYKNGLRRGFLLRPPSPAAPSITATTKSGNTLTIDFKGSPGLTGWKLRGSTDLVTFPVDLTPNATITEPTAGNYRAILNLTTTPARYFFRIETP